MYIEEKKPWKTLWIVGAIAACALLVLVEVRWPQLYDTRVGVDFPFEGAQPDSTFRMNPLLELFKLVAAAICGSVITWVHSRAQREKPIGRSVQHAQILLCISSALMMIIIGGSVARALGIVGGASIIRFRTPVDDPKDAVVFLILLGVGMASGLGAFAVVGLGTAFISLCLLALDNVGELREKPMVVALTAAGSEFPSHFVHRIFDVYGVEYDPGEVEFVQDKESHAKYKVRLPHGTPIEEMSTQLMNAGLLKSISWDKKDKK
jgi:hypothetical protein